MAEHKSDPQPDAPAPPRPETSTLEADVEAPTTQIIERQVRGAAGRTFEALRYHDYRYFFIGALLSNAGTWMQNVAQGWLITELTGSAFWVGALFFLSGLPVLLLALPAGVLADRVDRRRLLLWGIAGVAVLAFALAWLVQTSSIERGNWTLLAWVAVVVFLTGALTAGTFPTWTAMVSDLVPRETLLNAISLNSAQFHAARLIGPALAGALMARLGLASAFWANAISYLAVIWALWVIRPESPRHQEDSTDSIWAQLTGGIRYARQNPAIAVLLSSVALTAFFGTAYVVLLPLVVSQVMHAREATYAYLMAANGLGALLGALAVANLARRAHKPTLIRGGLIVFSLVVGVFSFFPRVWLAVPLLVVAGAAFLTMQSATNTALQAATPHHLRGRVMALFVLAFMGIMPIGGLVFGALGQAMGVTRAIAAGAAVCLAWGVVLTTRRGLLSGID